MNWIRDACRAVDWTFVAASAAVLVTVLFASLYLSAQDRSQAQAERIEVDRTWLRKKSFRDNLALEAEKEANRWPATPASPPPAKAAEAPRD